VAPAFDVDCEPITVFRVEGTYYFAHYFEREDVFAALREYYEPDSYRFEVSAADWDDVAATLADAFYEPDVVEDVEPYCVVTGKYDEHADVLRNSVLTWERRGHRFFVMKDALAVQAAVEAGARRLAETEFEAGI